MRPQRRGVPAGFHGYRATLTHPGFEAGEEAFELAQSASEQIVNVASLWNALSKVGPRGIGIAFDDRDLVEDVAQNAGGAHPRQTAADHQSASGGHGPLPPKAAILAAPMRCETRCRQIQQPAMPFVAHELMAKGLENRQML
jgi:hypothetical protein